MTRLRFLAAVLVGISVLSPLARAESGLGAPAVAQASSPPAAVAKGRHLNLATKPWTGDFDAMLERRSIRFLVPFSRTLNFNDKGQERGLTAELARDFERYLNKRYASRLGKRPVTVFLIPTTRDKLLTNLQTGLGDISAVNLTATEPPRKCRRLRILAVTGDLKHGKRRQDKEAHRRAIFGRGP